jgi:hypothetical protein
LLLPRLGDLVELVFAGGAQVVAGHENPTARRPRALEREVERRVVVVRAAGCKAVRRGLVVADGAEPGNLGELAVGTVAGVVHDDMEMGVHRSLHGQKGRAGGGRPLALPTIFRRTVPL